MNEKNSFLKDSLHIGALCAFAFAQPLYSLLGKNAEFFIFRRSQPGDIWALVFVFSLAIPLALIGFQLLLRLLTSDSIRRKAHLGTLALLLFYIILPVMNRFIVLGVVAIILSILLAAGLAYLYTRFEPLSLFLSVLSPTIIIFPLLFLFNSPALQVTQAMEAAGVNEARLKTDTPVVMIILDEFPLSSLLKKDLTINKKLYPAFAKLADSSHWFRNATTVSRLTDISVPAILTGRYPSGGKTSSFADHPENLFTLFAGAYKFTVYETATRLCPDSLCITGDKTDSTGERLASLLNASAVITLYIALPKDIVSANAYLSKGWQDIYFWSKVKRTKRERIDPEKLHLVADGRIARIDEFLHNVDDAPSRLYFLHSLYPHIPYVLMPSGKHYNKELAMPGWDFQTELWQNDPVLVHQAYKRHLLQLQFTDKILDKIIRKLKAAGIYEKCLFVLAADHGVSFKAGKSRREVTPDTLHNIASIPLFIKLPGQSKGTINDENVQTIDILPSIAAALQTKLPWKSDGRNLFAKNKPAPSRKALEDTRFTANLDTLRVEVDRKIKLFGENSERIFQSGPFPEILGKPAASLAKLPATGAKFALNDRRLLDNADPSSIFVPAYITGRLIDTKTSAKEPLKLALAVNGIIRATTHNYSGGGGASLFSVLAPESAFRRGKNLVQVYQISKIGEKNLALIPFLPADTRKK